MRMDEQDNRVGPAGMLAGQNPLNGKTLALLCLKFVKHRDAAEIRQNPGSHWKTSRKF
jgi:hypothetical protein